MGASGGSHGFCITKKAPTGGFFLADHGVRSERGHGGEARGRGDRRADLVIDEERVGDVIDELLPVRSVEGGSGAFVLDPTNRPSAFDRVNAGVGRDLE